MDYTNLRALGLALAKADKLDPVAYSFESKSFSYNDLQDTFRDELNKFAGDFYGFEQNKMTVYKLMSELITEVLPQKASQRYMDFAETKITPQGGKAIFTVKKGRKRAKQFISRVGLAGLYDVFKLSSDTIEVPTGALGGAAQIGLEEFLDKRVDFSELLEIIMEGLDEAIFQEVGKALESLVSNTTLQGFKTTNIVVANSWIEKPFDQLLSIADSFGQTTIYCTQEFAAQMKPDVAWASDDIKSALWNEGYLTSYKKHLVVILPQSVDDEGKRVIDPTLAYLFPTGKRPIKLAFEGQTIIDEFKNNDRSREIQAYLKFGVVPVVSEDLFIYQNLSIGSGQDHREYDWTGVTAAY